MVSIILTLLILAAGAALIVPAVLRMLRSEGQAKPGEVTRLVVVGIVTIAAVVILPPSFGEVPAGHRGVVLQFGAVTGEVKPEGLYFVMPIAQRVTLMDVQVHADKSRATAASHDLQNVATEVTVNYRLDPTRAAEVYRDLRDEYVQRLMVPSIQEAVKSATAQFNAENLVIERPKVKDAIEEFLQARLRQHGIIVDGIAITDFAFSADFSNAIEAKVTSLQLALKAKNDVEITHNEQLKKYETARADSYETVTGAKAAAEAIRIQTAAINSQGGKDYVQLKAIEKWNGDVPQWMGIGQATPFVNLTGK